MTSLTDDNREIAGGSESFELFMSVTNQWAGGISEFETGCAPFAPLQIGSAMSGDHHAMGVRSGIVERSFGDALGLQLLANDGVMDELTENGEGTVGGEFFGLGNGVADAETDPEMSGEKNFHKWKVEKVGGFSFVSQS